ncbi:MAG TPA: hypothetical protein VMQ59_08035 [Acidimicrobiales bacterium]|jgi:hypothetical protein|nr:hypothetical protein [Acidimicrobiales bacterium]
MELKAGTRLKSAVGSAEVVIVRPPDQAGTLTSGGVPLVGLDDEVSASEVQPGSEGEVLLGKRYVDAAATIEVLCTKAGEGSLAFDGEPLEAKSAKPLPSSD